MNVEVPSVAVWRKVSISRSAAFGNNAQQADHVSLGPCFIDKDQSSRVQIGPR